MRLFFGGLTSLVVTPLALLFGMAAGYFGKRVDDAIQYLYTVLDSIPFILLLIAMMMVLGRGIVQMCIALGVTSWVSLCRLSRGETLKHRDREYVRAARALGASHGRILVRHILPNLMPIVIISVTLGISGLVLSEAILSYLQLGVQAGVGSWGNMIDAARMELAREPVIWWNLISASGALFILVLAFNILGDALRDAIDRLRFLNAAAESRNLRTYFRTPSGTARAVDGIDLVDEGETLAISRIGLWQVNDRSQSCNSSRSRRDMLRTGASCSMEKTFWTIPGKKCGVCAARRSR